MTTKHAPRDFRATCTLGESGHDGHSDKDRAHVAAHNYVSGTISFSDPTEYAEHVKLRPDAYRPPNVRPFSAPKGWKPPARRDFDPKLGEVGSWVTLPDGTVGQVWSVIKGGQYPRVYVADGSKYHAESVHDLKPATDPAEQIELDAPTDDTPNPVTVYVIDPTDAETTAQTMSDLGLVASEAAEADYGPVGIGDRVIVNTGTRRGALAKKINGQEGLAEGTTKTHVDIRFDNGEHMNVPRNMVQKNNSGLKSKTRPEAADTVSPDPVPAPTPTPIREDAPKRPRPAERKVWNRALAQAARDRGADTYRAVMAAWDDVTTLRLSGVTPEDALTQIVS